jgi:hypothetical protein
LPRAFEPGGTFAPLRLSGLDGGEKVSLYLLPSNISLGGGAITAKTPRRQVFGPSVSACGDLTIIAAGASIPEISWRLGGFPLAT